MRKRNYIEKIAGNALERLLRYDDGNAIPEYDVEILPAAGDLQIIIEEVSQAV